MNTFFSGQELASLVVSSDLLNQSWDLISDCYRNAPGFNHSVVFKTYPFGEKGAIVAFVTSPVCTLDLLQRDGCDLVSSEAITPSFEFIHTNNKEPFHLRRAAIQLFNSILDELSLLKDQLCTASEVIITGHSLGGCVASLFTLWLLDCLPLNNTAPRHLCITFGSPLLGDNVFRRAMSEHHPSWNSRFLHVAYNQDPVPLSFIVQQTVPSYEPFGTFLFCSESDCMCLEEPDSTLEYLRAMSSSFSQSQDTSVRNIDYVQILRRLNSRIVSRGSSLPGDSCAPPLQQGITMQLEAIGVDKQNNIFDLLLRSIEKSAMLGLKRSSGLHDQTKKLNESKKAMIYLEWYKKSTVEEGGYYDSFKNARLQSGERAISTQEIVKQKKMLEKCWDSIVKEAERRPKIGLAFHTRLIYAGTNYRRMVEPLDIAEYYRKGKRDYRNHGRPPRYKQLEQWMNEDKQARSANSRAGKAVSLTEDSCFWADVEEALLCCRLLKSEQSSVEEKAMSRECLVRFEEHVMSLIRNCSVSAEIFLKRSTFMEWWVKFNEVVDPSYTSQFTQFMTNGQYNSYANGDEYCHRV